MPFDRPRSENAQTSSTCTGAHGWIRVDDCVDDRDSVAMVRTNLILGRNARSKALPSIAHAVVIVTFQTHDSKTLAIGLPVGSLPCSMRV